MQHHGAPTRLLDWSYSIYVAAYFAVENAEDDCAVWALNTDWLVTELKDLFKNDARVDFLTKGIEDTAQHRKDFYFLFFHNMPKRPFIASLALFRMNERLTIQKGTFVVPSALSKGFEDNLVAMKGYDDCNNLKKVVIPKSLRKQAIEALFYMNISRATLFPGLDGFSSSLGIYHPALDTRKVPEP